MHKQLPDGQMLYLFSTLDENIDPMADLYEKRWRAETNIGQFKSTLCGEAFRSKTVEMVHKELLMAIDSYNLTVQVRRLAAQKGGVAPRELSLQSVWSLVIVFFQCIAGVRTEQEIAEEFEKLIDLAGKKKLPKRKKPRSYQRSAYPKRKKFRPRNQSVAEHHVPTELVT